jgi:hypothetical protein
MERFKKIVKIDLVSKDKMYGNRYNVFFEGQEGHIYCGEKEKKILEIEDALYRTGISPSMQELLSEYKEAVHDAAYTSGMDSGLDSGYESGRWDGQHLGGEE